MADDKELVHSFEKSSTEQIQVSLSTFKGKTYVDLRIYYKGSDGEYRPTKKASPCRQTSYRSWEKP